MEEGKHTFCQLNSWFVLCFLFLKIKFLDLNNIDHSFFLYCWTDWEERNRNSQFDIISRHTFNHNSGTFMLWILFNKAWRKLQLWVGELVCFEKSLLLMSQQCQIQAIMLVLWLLRISSFWQLRINLSNGSLIQALASYIFWGGFCLKDL